jgi:hypothetical protein
MQDRQDEKAHKDRIREIDKRAAEIILGVLLNSVDADYRLRGEDKGKRGISAGQYERNGKEIFVPSAWRHSSPGLQLTTFERKYLNTIPLVDKVIA